MTEPNVKLNDLPLWAGKGDAPLAHMARVDDPATSKDAAVAAKDDFAADHRAKIMKALRHFGANGGTAKEIASYLDGALDTVQITRRIHELRASQSVESFDGIEHNRVTRPLVKRGKFCVHVVREHAAAASAIFAAERARRERDAMVERMAS